MSMIPELPYIRVNRKKRKKPNSGGSTQDGDGEISLQNKYESLSELDDSDTESMNVDFDPVLSTANSKVPPIVIYSFLKEHRKTIIELQTKLKEQMELKVKRNRIVFYTKTIDDYNVLKAEITKSNLEYHTYTLPAEKQLKLLIKGLPPNITENEIIEELKSKDITPLSVYQITNKSKDDVVKYPLYTVTFPNGTLMKNVVQIKRLCSCVIYWEKFKNKRKIIQCYKCQSFGHVAKNCFKNAKCVNIIRQIALPKVK